MLSDYIRDDILAEVLTRVPFKALYRFRCVSKSWRDLIDSSYMVEMRSTRSWSPNETVFVSSARTCRRARFIKAEEAEQLLKPLSLGGNPYTKICFKGVSFNMKAAQVAAHILSSMKHQLKEVDLSGIADGRPKTEALEVVTLFSEALEGCVLKHLSISDNALGEEEVRAFGKLLKSQTRLEQLYLIRNRMSDRAARAVCELLPDQTHNLRVLEFHGDALRTDGALAISQLLRRCPRLEDFRCNSWFLFGEGWIALAEALQICTRLKKLYLCGYLLELEAAIALSHSVSHMENLIELNLSQNHSLGDEGTRVIADAIRISAPRLQVLEFASCKITARGAAAVAACIADKHHLQKLNLSSNYLEDDDAVLISSALENGHQELKELNVAANLLTRLGARAIAESVVNKPDFKWLLIGSNPIAPEGIRELKQMFEKFPERWVLRL